VAGFEVIAEAWRTRHYYDLVRRALQGTLGRRDFRIVHVSIQHTHVHLLVEAENRKALTRGMQSFAIRLARLVHRADKGRIGCGKVFAYRYHATQIRTARHARHALAYVLNNWRRHRIDLNERDTAKLDRSPPRSRSTAGSSAARGGRRPTTSRFPFHCREHRCCAPSLWAARRSCRAAGAAGHNSTTPPRVLQAEGTRPRSCMNGSE
jgi:REP element-mobilizing transposase RayT